MVGNCTGTGWWSPGSSAQRQELPLKVAANNCFALYVDDIKVLDHWGVGEALPAEEGLIEIWLSAGRHELELHYYEWE